MWDKFWLVMTTFLMIQFSVTAFYRFESRYQNWWGVIVILLVNMNAFSFAIRLYELALSKK